MVAMIGGSENGLGVCTYLGEVAHKFLLLCEGLDLHGAAVEREPDRGHRHHQRHQQRHRPRHPLQAPDLVQLPWGPTRSVLRAQMSERGLGRGTHGDLKPGAVLAFPAREGPW